MSMTAHLLFQQKTQLPSGNSRVHRMGGKWVDETAKAPRMIDSKVSAKTAIRLLTIFARRRSGISMLCESSLHNLKLMRRK